MGLNLSNKKYIYIIQKMKVKNLRSKNTKIKLKKKTSKKPVWELTIVFPLILEMILETLPLLRFLKGVPGLR